MKLSGPIAVLGILFATAIAILTLVLVYQPGLSGSFILDDRRNIELNEAVQMNELSQESLNRAWWGGVTGGLGRPVSSLSFALTHHFLDGSAYSYKITNLFIHIINALVVTGFSVSLLRFWTDGRQLIFTDRQITAVALLTGLTWALHPLHASTVLYAVQRMTMLSAFFTVAALWVYVLWRKRLDTEALSKWLLPIAILGLVLLGILSKENAILFFGFIALIEFFGAKPLPAQRLSRFYTRLFWVVAFFTLVFGITYLHFFEDWFANSYRGRNFDLAERLMTESRMVFIYLQWILFPSIDQYGLFHDDIAISRGLLSPASTLWSALGCLVLVTGAVVSKNKYPWLGFGIGFYLIGHSLEGTVIPLELVFEHRNYLPSFGIVLLLLIAAVKMCELLAIRKRVYTAVGFAIVVFLGSMTLLRAMEWSSYFSQITAATERHPKSARSQWAMGIWYLQAHTDELLTLGLDDPKLYKKGKEHALLAAEADDEYVSSYLGLILFHFQHDRIVPRQWLVEVGERLANSTYRVESDDYFRQLVKCTQSDRCFAVQQDVDYLFNKVFENTWLTDGPRSNLLSGYSAFVYDFDKYELSMQSLAAAMALKPTVIGYRNLTVLALEMNDRGNAELYLKELKNLPGSDELEELLRLEALVFECCEALLPEKKEN